MSVPESLIPDMRGVARSRNFLVPFAIAMRLRGSAPTFGSELAFSGRQ